MANVFPKKCENKRILSYFVFKRSLYLYKYKNYINLANISY